MHNSLPRRAAATLILCAFTVVAYAAGDVSITYGTGPDAYRSRTLDALFDIGDSNWQFHLQRDDTAAAGGYKLAANTAGLRWAPSEKLDWSLDLTRQHDDQIETDGADLGVSIYLNRTLWTSDTSTQLEFDVGYYEHKARNDILAERLRQRGFESLTQTRYGVGLSQDIGDQLTVSIQHDEYHYSEDPTALAKLLVRRLNVPLSKALVLTAFPESGNSAGLTLHPHPRLDIDFSYARLRTVLSDVNESVTVAPTWRFGDKDRYSLSAGVTQARTNNSHIDTTYFDMTFGASFE